MTFDVEFILNDCTFNVTTDQGAILPNYAVTKDGTVVSQNADFAEVAEWADGNPNNEDRTGYFVCANVPLDGIVMKKAKSTDDVKGVTIQAPAFAGNYSKDKLDSNGNLLPKYSYVAIIGFVPVIDNGTCTVGGRCMPDDNGCAVPSSNSMGYQAVNRIDENRVLIIIEPNGDMVQRIKTKINKLQKTIDDIQIGEDGSVIIPTNAIQLWQPSTEYKVGDVVIADTVAGFEIGNVSTKYIYEKVIAECVKAHTSIDHFGVYNGDELEVVWNIKTNISAYSDALGRPITLTYATKEELNQTVGDINIILEELL